MKIMTKEQFQKLNIEILEIKNQISEYLQKSNKEAFLQICDLMDTEQCGKLIGKDKELYVLGMMSNIARQEITQGENICVFNGRNIKQIVDLYQNLVFYLRRLEFDLPLELQKEFVSYMGEQQLSAICIWGVIQMAPYIYSKEKTLKNFMNLLEAI